MLDDIFHMLSEWVDDPALHQEHLIQQTPPELLLPNSDIDSPYTNVFGATPDEIAYEHIHIPEEYPSSTDHQHIEFGHDDSSIHSEAELGHPYAQHVTPQPYIPPTHHQASHQYDESDTYQVSFHDSIKPHETHWNLANFHGIGHPDQYSHYWQHQTGEDCAVMAQGEVLASITGQHFTEQQLCNLAQEHGWYDPQKGTVLENVGKILEAEGIPVNRTEHATFENLVNALQQDQRIIVGVNANEIWHPYHNALTGKSVKLPTAGHAVWVTGIDQGEDGSVKVILTDSALSHGQVEAVDVQDFLNAWEDAGNFMMATSPFPLAA